MDDAAQMPGVLPVKQVDKLVSERATLRFAVGIFDTWTDVQATVRDLTAGGMADNSFNCLGLYRVLAPLAARPDNRLSLRDLSFSGDAELTSVTDGLLAACLAERLRMGAPASIGAAHAASGEPVVADR